MSGEVGELVTVVGMIREISSDGMALVSFDRGDRVVRGWFRAEEISPMGFDDEEETSNGN